MKKYLGMILLVVLSVCGVMVSTQDASAYYKDNCFAIQYKHTDQRGTEGREVIERASTKKLCVKDVNGKPTLYVDGYPDNKDVSVSHPKFNIKSDLVVELEYCGEGAFFPNGFCPMAKKTITFNLESYGGKKENFEEFAKAIYDEAQKGAKDPSYVVLGFKDNKEGVEGGTSGGTGDEEEDENPEGSGVIGTCANQGGALSLGWIVCPIMELAGSAAQDIYNGAVEPALRVEPKLFAGEKSNVEQAWEVFRNFANIIFIIIIMVVIFSQLTGVGIDNYGIKKILPKLLVTFVLVNLSYYLCILAVDISNILGNAFQSMFKAMGDGMTMEVNISGADIAKEVVITAGSLVGVYLVGKLVTMTGDIWMSQYIAVVLLVSAIGVLISILFLFILLAAREAAIVVLIVLSPVPVVLYALPNTKNLFDKWLKMLEGLLLVYPIAGLLVGGGEYVSGLLLSAGMNDFWGSVTAMIAGILPIFFIPTVLKNSFSALGNLGARISSMGDRASRGVTGSIRGSEAYKGLQDRNLAFVRRKKYEKGRELLNASGRMQRVARFMVGGERGILRNATKVRSDERQFAQDRAEAMDLQYGNTELGSRDEGTGRYSGLMGMFQNACNNGNTDDARALASVITNRYGAAGVNQIAQHLRSDERNADTQNNRAISAALRQSLVDDSNFGNTMRSKAGDVYESLSNGGMQGDNYVGTRPFTAHMGTDGPITSDADFASQSRGTLEAAINAGALTTDRMRSLLTSDDQSVIAALQGDPGKRELIEQAYVANGGDSSYTQAGQQQHQKDVDDAIIKIGNAASQLANSANSLGNTANSITTSANNFGNAADRITNATNNPSISIPHNTQPTRTTPPPRPETNIDSGSGADFVSE